MGDPSRLAYFFSMGQHNNRAIIMNVPIMKIEKNLFPTTTKAIDRKLVWNEKRLLLVEPIKNIEVGNPAPEETSTKKLMTRNRFNLF